MPTLAEFVRHAELFGTECVYETAESYLSGTELVQLDRELTRIDTDRRKRFGSVPTCKRMSVERKREVVAFLDREGLPDSRIANQLGVSERWVRALRKRHLEAQGSPQEAQEQELAA